MDRPQLSHPHVLIFPFPLQGHVNSMLKLAEFLCLADINITFLVSQPIHDRLLGHTNIASRFAKYPGFVLESLPGGNHAKDVHSPGGMSEFFDTFLSIAKPYLRNFFTTDRSSDNTIRAPVTTIIADGILSAVLDVAQEIGVPVICFHTIGASAFWAYFCIPQLIEARELPLKGSEMDKLMASVKGLEGILRGRDLPSVCRTEDLTSHDFNVLLRETLLTARAKGFILNTFEDLEAPVLSHIRARCPNLYTIGPIHTHLKTRLPAGKSSSNSLWEEDRSCLDWLDEQPSKSVLYVGFGSITVMTRENLLEFWHGIVNSGVRFLWVIRQDSITTKDAGENKSTPAELEAATAERGLLVDWAPQEEVLAHPAVGGFLTHSGWNSTLESIVEGVPMICWPYFVDQQTNSRMVAEAWKIGLDMKDTCDRVIVEKMIKDLMEVRKDEFLARAGQMAELARKSIGEGGPSYCNLDRLIQDIREFRLN